MWSDGSFEKNSFHAGSWLFDLVAWINSVWRSFIVPKEARGYSVRPDR